MSTVTPKPVKLRYKQFIDSKSNDMVIEIRLGADEFAILDLNQAQMSKIQELEKSENVYAQIQALLIALEMIEEFKGIDDLYNLQHGMMGGTYATSSYIPGVYTIPTPSKYQAQPMQSNLKHACPNGLTSNIQKIPTNNGLKHVCLSCQYSWII